MADSPYGFWTSPITSDLVVADLIRLEQVALDGDAIYWSETQPQKQGRTFVYRVGADGEPESVTPDDANAFSVRTRAREYGGGSFSWLRAQTGSIGVRKPRRLSIASAASRHSPSHMRRPVSSTPIGSPVTASRPAGTQTEGRPNRLAGSTGRLICPVAATFSGEATSKPTSKGNCVQTGDKTSGYSAMNCDQARARP